MMIKKMFLTIAMIGFATMMPAMPYYDKQSDLSKVQQLFSPLLEELSPKQIIKIGFSNPEIIQNATRGMLEQNLPTYRIKEDRVAAEAIWMRIYWIVFSKTYSHIENRRQSITNSKAWDQIKEKFREDLYTKISPHLGASAFYIVRDPQVMDLIKEQLRLHQDNENGEKSTYELILESVKEKLKDTIDFQISFEMSDIFFHQMKKLQSQYSNLASSDHQHTEFIDGIVPLLDRLMSAYLFFYVKKIFELSENEEYSENGSRMSIFESLMEQNKERIDYTSVNLAKIFITANSNSHSKYSLNLRNMLFPVKMYSSPLDNGCVIF